MAECLGPPTQFEPDPPKVAYPWEVWTNGKVHVLSKGVDYQIETVNMRSVIYMHARRKNCTVSVTRLSDTLTFRFDG